ncbi:MAG: hypothetical protein J5828_01600, partial [Desulfovibrionaceae bacterium]|nr:hypothetical protein [Desulfovibrionaceae bacterium]
YIVRLEQAERLESLEPIIADLETRLESPQYAQLCRLFIEWLKRVVFKRAGITENVPELKSFQEVHTMLAERAATWKDMYIQEGLAEGILKGRSEGLVQGRSEGRIRALAESIRAMTTALGLSEDRACEILNVSEDDKKALALLLKQQPAPLPE